MSYRWFHCASGGAAGVCRQIADEAAARDCRTAVVVVHPGALLSKVHGKCTIVYVAVAAFVVHPAAGTATTSKSTQTANQILILTLPFIMISL